MDNDFYLIKFFFFINLAQKSYKSFIQIDIDNSKRGHYVSSYYINLQLN